MATAAAPTAASDDDDYDGSDDGNEDGDHDDEHHGEHRSSFEAQVYRTLPSGVHYMLPSQTYMASGRCIADLWHVGELSRLT